MAPNILSSPRWFAALWMVGGCFLTPRGVSAQAAPAKPDFSGESFVIEQLTDEVQFSEDGTGQEDQIVRVRIQSEAGVQRFGVLSAGYRNERDRLEIVQVRVTKPDGSHVDTPESDAQDLPAEVTRVAPTYSDVHEKQIPVKALGIGDTLEWHTRTVHLKADAPGQFWYSHDFVHDAIVLGQTLQISVPVGKSVKVSSPSLKPEIREAAGQKIYLWKTSQLSRPPEESDKKIKPRLRPLPAVQLTSFRSWEEVGRWYGSLQQPKVEVTPALQAKAAELTTNLKTDAEKERALYQFVSTKFRYISISFGDGWYQPHSAAEVLANQYGDCKDKHTLLATLLKAAGIEAWPALIGAGNTVDPDVPSPGQFNHLITYVPGGNGGTWLDSTPEVAPFGMLSDGVREQHALVIPLNGAPSLRDTPDASLFPNQETVKVQSKLSAEGTLNADFDIATRGDDELVLRTVFHATAPKDWPTVAKSLAAVTGVNGTVSNLDVANPLDTAAPFHLSYKAEEKKYSDWENRRITPPLPPVAFPYSGEEEAPAQALDLGIGKSVYRATVAFPEGYSAEIPTDVKLDSPFAQYASVYTVDKGVLSVERTVTFKKTKLAAAEWEQYRKFVKSVNSDQGQYIRVVRAGALTGNTVVRDNAEAAEMLQKAGEAVQRRDLNGARDALAQAERLNPQQNGLWALYGFVYAWQRQNDKAIESFQKEIQFHPGNEPVYLALAEAQHVLKRRADEIQTLTKLLQIAPQNVVGALALAQDLKEAKRYSEAGPPLREALKANPDNDKLEVSLLEVLLRQGQKEEAFTLLAKARQQAKEPEQLNAVAYILADTNSEVSTAAEMSEKASSAYEERIGNTALATVTTDHFKTVESLGNTWDTVGWAQFQAGDLAKAEKYLNAAWLLVGNPVMADHLGQTYEREGRKADAIHAYQLSLAGNKDQPDTRKRLEALGGTEDDPPIRLRRGKVTGPSLTPEDELSQMRTTPLPDLAAQMGTAEFFLLFSPAGVQDVHFIRGDESLKMAGAKLAKAHYQMTFPDQGPEKIVRRGILSCSKYTMPSCMFVLLLPSNTTTD